MIRRKCTKNNDWLSGGRNVHVCTFLNLIPSTCSLKRTKHQAIMLSCLILNNLLVCGHNSPTLRLWKPRFMRTTGCPSPGWFHRILKAASPGTSLAVQWLGPHAASAGSTGWNPSWGSKIPHAAWHGLKNKTTNPVLFPHYGHLLCEEFWGIWK